MAPGTAMMPTTATCCRITEMFCGVRNRSLDSEKKTVMITKAKNSPLRCDQARTGKVSRIAA